MISKRRSLLAAVVGFVAAAAIAAPGAAAADEPDTTPPNVLISPGVAHVTKGKIRLNATCPAEEVSCSGVILGRLPLPYKRGSALDPGGLGGPILTIQGGQTVPIVFTLTPKTKAFLKTHARTTLTVTVKMLDEARNGSEEKVKVILHAR
jgi:hypothetical protein